MNWKLDALTICRESLVLLKEFRFGLRQDVSCVPPSCRLYMLPAIPDLDVLGDIHWCEMSIPADYLEWSLDAFSKLYISPCISEMIRRIPDGSHFMMVKKANPDIEESHESFGIYKLRCTIRREKENNLTKGRSVVGIYVRIITP